MCGLQNAVCFQQLEYSSFKFAEIIGPERPSPEATSPLRGQESNRISFVSTPRCGRFLDVSGKVAFHSLPYPSISFHKGNGVRPPERDSFHFARSCEILISPVNCEETRGYERKRLRTKKTDSRRWCQRRMCGMFVLYCWDFDKCACSAGVEISRMWACPMTLSKFAQPLVT